MTALTKAIDKLKEEKSDLGYSHGDRWRIETFDKAITLLESLLPEEEKMLRDAWEAAGKYYVGYEDEDKNSDEPKNLINRNPDLETYINNLKKKI